MASMKGTTRRKVEEASFSEEIKTNDLAIQLTGFLGYLANTRNLMQGISRCSSIIVQLEIIEDLLNDCATWIRDYLDQRIGHSTLLENIRDHVILDFLDALDTIIDHELTDEEHMEELLDVFSTDHMNRLFLVKMQEPGIMETCLDDSTDDDLQLKRYWYSLGLLRDIEILSKRLAMQIRTEGLKLHSGFIESGC